MSVYSNIPGSMGKTIPIDLIWEDNKIKCSKCNKLPSSIEYKGKSYCTWYCAKKGQFMIDINCRKDGCMNFVTCDEDVVAVTCDECCATLGINNNIVFGGQNGRFSNSNCNVR